MKEHVDLGKKNLYREFSKALPMGDEEKIKSAGRKLLTTFTNNSGDIEMNPKVMVAFGGGKDSSYALAFVRGMQLFLRDELNYNINLRVITFRHAGMPRAVMDNINNVYNSLNLYDDEFCEMYLIDGEKVSEFDPNLTFDEEVILRGRKDILLNGHKTAGDGRPTFCNSCNLNMARSFGIGATFSGGVDVIITGDSTQEQRDYYKWVIGLTKYLGVDNKRLHSKFANFLSSLEGIAKVYYKDIYGEVNSKTENWHVEEIKDSLTFFSIYDYTQYDSGSHWDYLTKHLKFKFDIVAFSFTESDCGNPGLMAHMRGLKAEVVYGLPYEVGVREYVKFATNLMRKKEFPDHLIEVIRERYSSEAGIKEMRILMESEMLPAHNITHNELVGVLFAPFIGEGKTLGKYLKHSAPELIKDEELIRQYLSGKSDEIPEQVLVLSSLTGLSPQEQMHIYKYQSVDSNGVEKNIVQLILDDDPHKDIISTELNDQGFSAKELISGR